MNAETQTSPAKGLVIFDCDSTLSSLEGIDELARLRGEEVFQASEAMTRDAMEGRIPLESVFAKRLELISPTREELEELGRQYLATLVPDAKEVVDEFKAEGWIPAILSAGLLPAVQMVGDHLGIEEIQAVPIFFDSAGNYADFGRDFPPTRSGGKPIVVKTLKEKYGVSRTIAVGDGVSDLETKSEVTCFVGFGGVVQRQRVKEGADRWVLAFKDLAALAR